MADGGEYMLTTVDNPWNPYTNYQEWYQYDQAQGYDSTGLLARVANVSLDLSEADVDAAIEEAIDEICKINVSGIHKKVFKPLTSDSQIKS
jgi:hypothetical protein